MQAIVVFVVVVVVVVVSRGGLAERADPGRWVSPPGPTRVGKGVGLASFGP